MRPLTRARSARSEGQPLGQRLDGKVALVTGAARGIGEAIAKLFAKEGAVVVLGDVLEAEGQATAKAIIDGEGQAIFLPLDVTCGEAWQRALERTGDAFGRLDVLVNNAGVAARAALEGLSREDWNRTMAVNALGPYLGIQHAAPQMAKTGGGSIINVCSVAALIGGGASMDYRASKGALRALTRVMALRYASQQVRVNAIFPGDVVTPMSQEYLEDPARAGGRLALIPLGRLGQPEDVARLILYLASDEASYVTGAGVVIDGGRTAH